MILSNISLDSLRTLVISQDPREFVRVSQNLGLPPPAINLQMKRVQEKIRLPIFRRQGRKMLLAEQGEIVWRYARGVLALKN